MGKRIFKETKKKRTNWLWDGNVPLHEWETQSTESLINVVTWIFEGGFVPCAKMTQDKFYSIVIDYLGTPSQMFDNSGANIWEAELDIYGKVRTFKDSSISDCPFRYQGQYLDNETGLYYNRFRYYDPEQGNLSKDPIGVAGGMKMYSYALNPTTRLDIFGLFHHTNTGHNVYGLYDVIGQDAMGNDILTDKPYYIGITNDPDVRATQHGQSGRLGDDSRMRVLDENVTYGQARGYEQAYIEHYETKTGVRGEDISSTNRGNKINSFDTENTTRAKDRQQNFEENRESKLKYLGGH